MGSSAAIAVRPVCGETAKVRIELRSDGTRRGNVERIIQIVSVRYNDDRRIFHFRMSNELASIECHEQALA